MQYHPTLPHLAQANLQTSTLIYLSGNVLQTISILVFTGFVIVIKRRAARLIASDQQRGRDYPLTDALLTQILISIGLFVIRLIVRIAQGAQGIWGYAMTREWVFGVFEYLPLFLILVLWAARPLHRFLFPVRGEVAESNGSVSETNHGSDAVAPHAQSKV